MSSHWKHHESVIELLDQFYCWKSTLREYFEYVFLSYNIDEKSRKTVFSGGSKRLESLLNGTVICCRCDVTVIPKGMELFHAFCDHRELVMRVIKVNCQKRTDVENVLSRGFSSCRHDSRRDIMSGSLDIQIDHPNTLASYMCSEIWQDLCSRIGCDLMLHVLQNMSMFLKMNKGNLLQISGNVVDKSHAKSKYHHCSWQIVQFLQSLPLLHPRALISRGKDSPQKKDDRSVPINSVEVDPSVNHTSRASDILPYENGSPASNSGASEPVVDPPKPLVVVDPSKLGRAPSVRAPPIDKDAPSLIAEVAVEPVKISAKRANEIRWLWKVLACNKVDDKHEKCLDGAALSPEVTVSPPPSMCSGLKPVRITSMYDPKSGISNMLQPPYKRKWRVEDHDESLVGTAEICCTEECNSRAIFRNGNSPARLKQEFTSRKKLKKDEIDLGLVVDSEEESDCHARLSREIQFSPPKKYSRMDPSFVELRHKSIADNGALIKVPCDKMPQMGGHNSMLASLEDTSCLETERKRTSRNLSREFSLVLSKQEPVLKENLQESNAPDGHEGGEICDKDHGKVSQIESCNSPHNFECGNRFNAENMSNRETGDAYEVDNNSIGKDSWRRDQQLDDKKLLKGTVSDARDSNVFCGGAGGRESERNACSEQVKEVKEVKKKYHSILNECNRKKKNLKFRPIKSSTDERYAFRVRRIMYSMHLRESLHSSHILNNIKPSNKGAHILGLQIFRRRLQNFASQARDTEYLLKQGPTVSKLPKNLRRSLPILRQLIHDYKKLKISKYLMRHCPSSKEVKKLRKSYNLHSKRLANDPSLQHDNEKQKALYEAALKDCIPPYKIFLFVKSVCTNLLPTSLLQSESNWKIFYNNLKRFFTLGKYEFLTLSMIMKGIKCSHCTWTYKSQKRPGLLSQTFSTWQRKSVETLILWIVADFIMPLLKACFYITEIGKYRQKAVYFRRSSWAAMECLARDTVLKNNFIEVGQDIVTEAVSKGYTSGCGKMRVIPKSSKLRPIINMRCARGGLGAPVAINYQVDRLLYVLKFLAREEPQLFGASVSDTGDINTNLKRFRRLITETVDSESGIYFVASDIECCFDSIPHCKLMNIAKSAVKKQEYFIRKFSATSFVMFRKCLTVTNRVAARDMELFPVFIENYIDSKDCTTSNSIITDGVFCVKEQRDLLHNSIWRHIKESYLKFGSRYYRLTRGIAQGSMISTHLCNLLYGHMERTHMREFLDSEECLLMRWTDDFLLITTSKHLAEQFLVKLKAGFPEYGCTINLEKSKTNLPSDAGCQANIIQHVDELWFPWCNLLINTKTLEVRFSYDRYLGKSVGDSFSVRLDSRPGRRLISRMMQHVRLQTASIIIDPVLNSYQNILINVYQIFCFVAIKFNRHVTNLPKDGQPNARPKFFYMVVHCIFTAFYRQYRRVHNKVCSGRIPLISKSDLKSLYYSAILNILKKRKTRYGELTRLIRRTAVKYNTKKFDTAKIKQESAIFDRIK